MGYFAMAVVAAAVILVEVSVTRVLAYRLYYHYVYLVISTALLGIGAGASFVALRRIRGRPIGRQGLVAAVLVFAGLNPVILFLITRCTPEPNVGGGKIGGSLVLLFLPWVYLLLTALFAAAGIATAVLFSRFRDRIARLYFFDLAAGAAAAIASVLLMKYATPLRAFLLAGLLMAVLAAVAGGRGMRLAGAAAALAIAVLVARAPSWFNPTDNLFGGGATRPRSFLWNHQARVDFLGDYLSIDNAATTRIPPPVVEPIESAQSLSRFHEIPFDLTPHRPDRVAIIGSGGGRDVYDALRRGAARVVAIEINRSIFESMRQRPRSVYNHPRVVAIEGEGRHTLRARGEDYDLIQLSLIDTYTASASGAYALSENYLYTVEAFEEYVRRLRPGGVLFITRWEFKPPRETLRLCTIGEAALRHLGVSDPSQHIAVLERGSGPGVSHAGFLLFRDPITAEQKARIEQLARENHYRVAFLPGDAGTNEFHRFFAAPDKKAFLDGYPFLIDPPTDSQPFYFQYFRLGQFHVPDKHWHTSMHYMAQVIILLTLGLALACSMVIIVWPARRLARDGALAGRRPATAGYFGALGLGFMLVEIPLIQQFTLYLGHPTHALVTILSSLLVSAGIGSLVAGRLPLGRRTGWILAAIAVVIALSAAIVPWLAHASLGLPFAARLATCLACVGAIGFLLGLPMTLGIRAIAEAGESSVAWAWACNGACSVVASCVAMLLLVYFGFTWAMAASAASYCLAAVCLPRLLPGQSARDAVEVC